MSLDRALCDVLHVKPMSRKRRVLKRMLHVRVSIRTIEALERKARTDAGTRTTPRGGVSKLAREMIERGLTDSVAPAPDPIDECKDAHETDPNLNATPTADLARAA